MPVDVVMRAWSAWAMLAMGCAEPEDGGARRAKAPAAPAVEPKGPGHVYERPKFEPEETIPPHEPVRLGRDDAAYVISEDPEDPEAFGFPQDSFLYDLDQDGQLDIVLRSKWHTYGFLTREGGPEAGQEVLTSTDANYWLWGSGSYGITSGDLDGDGLDDLVLTSYDIFVGGHSFIAFAPVREAEFVNPRSDSPGWAMVWHQNRITCLVDADGDGQLDLMSHRGDFVVHYGPIFDGEEKRLEDAETHVQFMDTPGAWPAQWVKCEDFTGDGVPDVGFWGNYKTYIMPGPFPRGVSMVPQVWRAPYRLALGPPLYGRNVRGFGQDAMLITGAAEGREDDMLTRGLYAHHVPNASGEPEIAMYFDDNYASTIHVADMNGDGADDLVMHYRHPVGNQIRLFLWPWFGKSVEEPDVVFEIQEIYGAAYSAVADVNNDGLMDILMASASNSHRAGEARLHLGRPFERCVPGEACPWTW